MDDIRRQSGDLIDTFARRRQRSDAQHACSAERASLSATALFLQRLIEQRMPGPTNQSAPD
jgi:hypothetical protein